MKPTTMYAGVGFVVGIVVGSFFADKLDPVNLLIGAFFGAFGGLLLAVSKYNVWNRK